MNLFVDLYWSFRSPYCYFLLPQNDSLEAEYRVNVEPLIVHLP